MRRHSHTSLAVALVLVGATGCATKGYVTTQVDERTREVEQHVLEVERGLEDTTIGTGRNTARIREVDRTANDALETSTDALETATAAVGASQRAQLTATDARARVEGIEQAGRRLLFEVIVTEEHGQFGFADATLPKPTSAKLDQLMDRVRSLTTPAHLEIEGHTDASGSAAYNARLALRRAESVRRYLHEHHRLPLHKINIITYGEERPVAPNDTAEGRAKNRRVVVRVLG